MQNEQTNPNWWKGFELKEEEIMEYLNKTLPCQWKIDKQFIEIRHELERYLWWLRESLERGNIRDAITAAVWGYSDLIDSLKVLEKSTKLSKKQKEPLFSDLDKIEETLRDIGDEFEKYHDSISKFIRIKDVATDDHCKSWFKQNYLWIISTFKDVITLNFVNKKTVNYLNQRNTKKYKTSTIHYYF